jgi:methylmalonyl-CoA mutase N-terminal domain/subunit
MNSLATLRQAATGNASLMPLIVDCVELNATLGEIADALRSIFGEYHEVMTV